MRYSAFEARIFTGASQALVAAPIDAGRVDRFLGDFARRAPWRISWGFKALLWLAWLAGFSRTDPAARLGAWDRALAHRRSAVRQLALVLKAMVCLCHFDSEVP